MVGQELTQHLQHIEERLAKLMKSYQDYQSRDGQKQQHTISLSRHILNIAAIIIIIIAGTYAIGSFILDAIEYIVYIEIIQALLSIGFYLFFAKKVTKESLKNQKSQSVKMTIYELDQLRFEMLQELATSPIPQNYITPTAIKKMHQLVKSSMCNTIAECTAQFNIETNKEMHEEELELIKKLQMISYH
ncbi:MAG: hypothetical protein ACQEWV_17000 [Bacillota bacterium]